MGDAGTDRGEFRARRNEDDEDEARKQGEGQLLFFVMSSEVSYRIRSDALLTGTGPSSPIS